MLLRRGAALQMNRKILYVVGLKPILKCGITQDI